MKTFMKSVALLAVASALILGSATMILAADKPAGKAGDKPIRGTVKITYDAADATVIKGITITDKAGTATEVVVNDKSKELKAYDGKVVAVKGTMADGKLTVTEIMPAPKKEGDKKK